MDKHYTIDESGIVVFTPEFCEKMDEIANRIPLKKATIIKNRLIVKELIDKGYGSIEIVKIMLELKVTKDGWTPHDKESLYTLIYSTRTKLNNEPNLGKSRFND